METEQPVGLDFIKWRHRAAGIAADNRPGDRLLNEEPHSNRIERRTVSLAKEQPTCMLTRTSFLRVFLLRNLSASSPTDSSGLPSHEVGLALLGEGPRAFLDVLGAPYFGQH